MNDFTAARALLRRGPVESFSPDFVVGVMRASYYRFGTAALSEFQDYLVPSILDADPIFAAEVMLGQQRPTDASRYLENAATLGMQPWKHDEWAKLVERITPVAARKHLMAIRPGGNPS